MAPRNLEIVTVTSNSITISWDQPTTSRYYTYALIVFDGQSSRSSSGTATSHTISGLEQGGTYLVFVVAIAGDDYSYVYRVYTLETGK